jgi:hypothetical protein
VEPDAEDVERARRALGERPVSWRAAPGHGAPSNRRYVVGLSGDRSAFLKIAAYDYTADWLRYEHRAYRRLDGAPFMPRLLGWDDDGLAPVLALEDLSGARWPPPWDDATVDAVLNALDLVHGGQVGEDLVPALDSQFGRDGWPSVIEDPAPLLSTGLCSREWLDANLPTLASASARTVIVGDSLLHFDVRSDNLCLTERGVVLVDWNGACIGNPLLDTASWLPSLEAEGGPRPEDVLPANTPGLPEMAAFLAGFFCARAGLPPIPQAPHARPLQLMQSRTALPWAARLLGLPPPA